MPKRRRIKPDFDEKFALDLEGEEAVRRLLEIEAEEPEQLEDEDS